ncbi:glycosyltransferase family 4 protein [Niabella hibiscisoli]|uniref:glycosyltransferase family 4 protein n=1 Tax=Niabella hibiscisoli TaxID=1825928 RepID=UPI001F0F7DC5|nr:glycosyltransferase family 4 protein [Niabella hibiscisoli]MCH5718714.1 glycosyltransferase family 4 protein [Niabella hibiscisoli]
MIEVWQNAQKCFFVSQQNLNLTEEQFGFRFSHAEVIWNPIKFKREISPLPTAEHLYKFACIGRFFILDKGQDILLRILADQSWKDRPIEVSFIGGGPDQKALQDLAEMLDVKNVKFAAHINDVENLWTSYHALILPSRSEGLPLVTLEAMAVGRPVIVSTAGGHAEIIQHGVNGFIADATVKDFAKAMEDAWENRNSWELIGKNANAFVKEKVPALPERIFSDLIIKIIS